MFNVDYILYHTIGLTFESYLNASDLFIMQQVCTSAHDGYYAIKFRRALSKLRAMDDTLLQEIPLRVIAKSFKLSLPFLYSIIELLYYKGKIQLYTLILAQAEMKTYNLQVLKFIYDYNLSFVTKLTNFINPFSYCSKPLNAIITDLSKRSNPEIVRTLLTQYKQLDNPFIYPLDPEMRKIYTEQYNKDETYGLSIKEDFIALTIKEAIACKDTYPLIAYAKIRYNDKPWLEAYLEIMVDHFDEFHLITIEEAKKLALELLKALEDPNYVTYHRMCNSNFGLLKGRRYLWDPYF